MEVDGEVRSDSGVRLSEATTAAISAFATDLAQVIEQLESDCARDQMRRETAARIHELRERAEQIFGDSD